LAVPVFISAPFSFAIVNIFYGFQLQEMARYPRCRSGRNGPQERDTYLRRTQEELFDVLVKARSLDELLMIEPMAREVHK
jgi:hypothetical protein